MQLLIGAAAEVITLLRGVLASLATFRLRNAGYFLPALDRAAIKKPLPANGAEDAKRSLAQPKSAF